MEKKYVIYHIYFLNILIFTKKFKKFPFVLECERKLIYYAFICR